MAQRIKRSGLAFSLSLCVLCAICFSPRAYAAESTVGVVINGKSVAFTESSGYPYADENNHIMAPLLTTLDAMGVAIGWDQTAQTAIAVTEHDRIEIPVGMDYLYNNNVKVQNEAVTIASKDGKIFSPIKTVLESAGYTVEWDSSTKTVIAYNFDYDSTTLVPYSTSDLPTLVSKVLAGDVVYVAGQYYATPDYVKLLANTQVVYTGDDLNTVIYPQVSRYDLIDFEWPE